MIEEGGEQKEVKTRELFRRAAVKEFVYDMTLAQAWNEAEQALRSINGITHPAKVREAVGFLAGLILHVVYSQECDDKTLRGVYEILSDPTCSHTKTLNKILATKHDPEFQLEWIGVDGKQTDSHPVVVLVAAGLLKRSEEHRDEILQLIMGTLASMPFLVGLEYAERVESTDGSYQE